MSPGFRFHPARLAHRFHPVRGAGALAAFAALLALSAAHAATPIHITSQVATDGPIRYTVKVVSKQFGNVQETRTIRSGQSDDFDWKSTPPGGPVGATAGCPDYDSLPLDANGAMIRETRLRLAPVVDANGAASVQLSFSARTPRGEQTVKQGGKSLKCPLVRAFSQVVHFDMKVNGSLKTVTLGDGTRISVSAQR